jgi:hypothetical protein
MLPVPGSTARPLPRAWLDILRGAWELLPALPAPVEVLATLREGVSIALLASSLHSCVKEGAKGGTSWAVSYLFVCQVPIEQELEWMEALAGCLGAAVAAAQDRQEHLSQVRDKPGDGIHVCSRVAGRPRV